MKNIKTFEDFINENNSLNEMNFKTKADIKKVFGKAVSDIDPDEDGGSFIIQGDLDKIKSIINKHKIVSEPVEHWGVRIWESVEDTEVNDSESSEIEDIDEANTLDRMPDKNLVHRLYKFAETLNGIPKIDDDDEYQLIDDMKNVCDILLKRHKNLK